MIPGPVTWAPEQSWAQARNWVNCRQSLFQGHAWHDEILVSDLDRAGDKKWRTKNAIPS